MGYAMRRISARNGRRSHPSSPIPHPSLKKEIMTDIQRNTQPQEEIGEASDCTLLELVGDPAQLIIHDRELTIDGRARRFHIKQLSLRECTEIDAKKYLAREVGHPERDVAGEETNAIAWLLHRCVVKNTGTADAPQWAPLWSLEEMKGHAPEFDARGNIVRQQLGLLDNPSKAAQELINKLTFVCWEVNEELNPFRQAQALKMLGIDLPTTTIGS